MWLEIRYGKISILVRVSKNQKHFGKTWVKRKGSEVTAWFQHQSILWGSDLPWSSSSRGCRSRWPGSRGRARRGSPPGSGSRPPRSQDPDKKCQILSTFRLVTPRSKYLLHSRTVCCQLLKFHKFEAKCRYILLGSGLLLPLKWFWKLGEIGKKKFQEKSAAAACWLIYC